MQEQELKDKIELKVPDPQPEPAQPDSLSAPVAPSLPNLGERYEVLSVIGSGGMSDVYKVKDRESEAIVVAKILKKGLLSDRVIKQRFKQESELIQQLNHDNIIKVRDYALTEEQTPFLIMDWLNGITLADYIKEHGPISSKQAIPIFAQIIQALAHAHQKNIIHRDIKPSNILLVKSDKGFVVKVMDFGIAKILESEDIDESVKTQTGSILGSPAYMSPEQCLGERIDARTDIYSLGCLMYETLTGTHPFIASTPVATILNHLEKEAQPLLADEFTKLKIPEHLDHCITKCLAKQPDLRYQSADAVQQALFPQPSLIARLFASILDLTLIASLAAQYQNLPLPGLKEACDLNSALPLQIMCLIYTVYFAAFESSPLHATPGKLFAGLRIGRIASGPPSLIGSIGRALTFCALLMCLYIPTTIGPWAAALDHATGSHYALLHLADGWLGFFIALYVIYSWLFVFSKKEQWHIDTFFGRNVISRQAAQAQSMSKPITRLGWPQVGALTVSLVTLVTLPWFSQFLQDEAWSNPLVLKDRTLIAAETIRKGVPISRKQLKFRPELRSGNPELDFHLYDPNALIGRQTTSDLTPGYTLDYYLIKNYQGIERGVPYWVQIGSQNERDGDKSEAELCYAKAVKLDPAEKEGWLGLARLYEQRGLLKQSNDARKRAGDIVLQNPVNLAKQLNSLGAYTEALSVARGTLAKNPTNYDMMREMAKAMDGLGAPSSAERIYNQLISAQTNDSFSLIRAAEKLHERGRNAAAKPLAIRATQVDPNNAKAWQVLARILSNLDEPKAASTAYNRAASLDPRLKNPDN